jgi:UDP-glucose 4-epimerase
VRTLFAQDIPLIALVRPDSDCWRLGGLKNVDIVRAASEEWPGVISQFSPRVVVAADWEGVDSADRGDREMQFENVTRAYAVAEAAKNSGVKVFVAFGSQAEIGPHSRAVTEIEKDNPVSIYGEAKVQTRKKLSFLFTDSSVRFVWGRIFSVYGPLDIGSGMLPTLIGTLKEGKVFNATKGDQTWSYLHVSDFTSAVLRIISGSEFKDVVNIGNPEGVQIGEVIKLVAQYMNRTDLVNFGAAEIDSRQSQYLIPVTSQLSRDMWKPEVCINDGVESMVDWFIGGQARPGSEEPLLLPEL